MNSRHRAASPARTIAGALVPAVLLAGLLAACDINRALEVESPSRIPYAVLENPANAALLVSGAASDFECAFGSYVVVTGLITDELEDYTQTAARWPYDRRDVQSNQSMYATNSCEGTGIYTPLQTARVSANNARRLLEGWSDAEVTPGSNRQQMIATSAAYEAWSMLLLGEAFCSTVLSTLNGQVFDYGGEVPRDSAFRAAETRFTQAITVGQAALAGTALTAAQRTATQAIVNMALLGRARARQDLGNLAGARADAALIPSGFRFDVTASSVSGRRNNRVYNESNALGVSSTVGLRYREMNDPRVPYQNLNRPNSLGVPAVAQLKYLTVTAPIALATYQEAQLIIAEADAASPATAANAIAIINTFRAQGNQGVYTGAADAASLRDEVVDQRRRALYLQGTQMGDVYRYGSAFRNAPGTVFPAGGTFGSQQCAGGTRIGLPLPDAERQNNPVLQG